MFFDVLSCPASTKFPDPNYGAGNFSCAVNPLFNSACVSAAACRVIKLFRALWEHTRRESTNEHPARYMHNVSRSVPCMAREQAMLTTCRVFICHAGIVYAHINCCRSRLRMPTDAASLDKCSCKSFISGATPICDALPCPAFCRPVPRAPPRQQQARPLQLHALWCWLATRLCLTLSAASLEQHPAWLAPSVLQELVCATPAQPASQHR
jgi:hypothetical protein